MAARVFISYRHADAPFARAVQSGLETMLSSDAIVRDVTSLTTGDALYEAIPAHLERSSVVLALVGPGWAPARPGGPVLDRAKDWVRLELSLALAWRKRVIPALVAGAPMPDRTQLPRDVRALADIVAIELRDSDWDHDIGRLADAIDPHRSRAPRSAGSDRPHVSDAGPVAGGNISIVGHHVAGRDLHVDRDD